MLFLGEFSASLSHLLETEEDLQEEINQDDFVETNKMLLGHMFKASPPKKYKCYSCEQPDCKEGPPCFDALQVCICCM